MSYQFFMLLQETLKNIPFCFVINQLTSQESIACMTSEHLSVVGLHDNSVCNMGRANTFTLEWFRQIDITYFTGSVTVTSVFMPPYSLLHRLSSVARVHFSRASHWK